jgi:hypothetical protein
MAGTGPVCGPNNFLFFLFLILILFIFCISCGIL